MNKEIKTIKMIGTTSQNGKIIPGGSMITFEDGTTEYKPNQVIKTDHGDTITSNLDGVGGIKHTMWTEEEQRELDKKEKKMKEKREKKKWERKQKEKKRVTNPYLESIKRDMKVRGLDDDDDDEVNEKLEQVDLGKKEISVKSFEGEKPKNLIIGNWDIKIVYAEVNGIEMTKEEFEEYMESELNNKGN